MRSQGHLLMLRRSGGSWPLANAFPFWRGRAPGWEVLLKGGERLQIASSSQFIARAGNRGRFGPIFIQSRHVKTTTPRPRKQQRKTKAAQSKGEGAAAESSDVQAKMDELARRIEAANRSYYAASADQQLGEPGQDGMSDAEYDALFDELQRLEERFPQVAAAIFTPDRPSPTQQVGYRPLTEVLRSHTARVTLLQLKSLTTGLVLSTRRAACLNTRRRCCRLPTRMIPRVCGCPMSGCAVRAVMRYHVCSLACGRTGPVRHSGAQADISSTCVP
jgi:hypothetical protein